uniref:Uncharacterized protein n=1 Tax=Romanomermis culicivorax TaxID=13658 RepID=A0A915J1P2_ROMCU
MLKHRESSKNTSRVVYKSDKGVTTRFCEALYLNQMGRYGRNGYNGTGCRRDDNTITVGSTIT